MPAVALVCFLPILSEDTNSKNYKVHEIVIRIRKLKK